MLIYVFDISPFLIYALLKAKEDIIGKAVHFIIYILFIITIFFTMEELIERLQAHAGLTTDQALRSIEVVKSFTKEKFPMFAGAIDKLFEKNGPAERDDFLD